MWSGSTVYPNTLPTVKKAKYGGMDVSEAEGMKGVMTSKTKTHD